MVEKRAGWWVGKMVEKMAGWWVGQWVSHWAAKKAAYSVVKRAGLMVELLVDR